jgi:alginate O-acetyltransferase complex protein AlgI
MVAAMLKRAPRALRTGYMLVVVLIGWVFFRAPTLDAALHYLGRMFAFGAQSEAPLRAFDLVTAHTLAVIAIAFALSLPLWPALKVRLNDGSTTRSLQLAASAYVALVLMLSFAAMAGQENSPFLYFRF